MCVYVCVCVCGVGTKKGQRAVVPKSPAQEKKARASDTSSPGIFHSE